MRRFGLILAAILPFAAHLYAQEREPEIPGQARYLALAANTEKLTRTFTLDRTVYLPGENILAVVTVVNSTPAALEVVDPIRMGSIILGCKVNDPKYPQVEWDRCDAGSRDEGLPVFLPGQVTNVMDGVLTTVLQPGQKLEQHLALMEKPSGGIKAGPIWILGPGEYRLTYCTGAGGGAMAEFRVADLDGAGLLTKVHAPWREWQTERATTSSQADMCVGVMGAVLSSGGEYITVVTHPTKDTCYRYGWEEKWLDQKVAANVAGRDLFRFTRIATSTARPAKLIVVPNSPEDMRVEVEYADGNRQVFHHSETARQ